MVSCPRTLQGWGCFGPVSFIARCDSFDIDTTIAHVVNAFYAHPRQQPAECWVKHQRPTTDTEDYVWKPYSCRYDLMNAEAQQKCFEDKGVSTFLDYGDR